MSKKIGFLQRWIFIIDKINTHPYISKEELENAVENELMAYDGVSGIGTKSRTIERDLREIRNSPSLNISIEYCHRRKGYYIPDDEKSISRLDRLIEISSLLSFSSLKDIVFVEDRRSRGLEYRYGLIAAIKKAVEVEIIYHKYQHSPNSKESRKLRPYGLKEFKSRWYLLATEVDVDPEKAGIVKAFGLDRIKKLTVTNRVFQKRADIDIKDKFKHCFGIYSNEELKPEKVVLSFSPLSGRYNDALPLHESQKTLVENEDEFRVELYVKITKDFIIELLSQSEGMRVIEPAGLRDTLIDIHKRAIEELKEQ